MNNRTRTIVNRGPALQIVGPMLMAAVVVLFSGCKNFVERAQSPDSQILQLDQTKKDGAKYIGDVARVSGLSYAKVEGIGLLVGLDDTGSNPKPSGQRESLARELESKSKGGNVEKTLASPKTELVLMQGLLPPGIQEGDKFDIEIRTLRNTDATSLENGVVLQTRMRPMANFGGSVKLGHINALGKGAVLVDALFETRKDQPNHLHGYILGGGVALEDRKLALSLQGDDIEPKTSTMIANAVNARFSRVGKSGRKVVAEPKTDRMIDLSVPDTYRHNVGRFLQVIIHLAYAETPGQRLSRLEQLERELQDPAMAGKSSLRLEAFGKDSVPALRRSLRAEDLEVRFYAAQALAYLGEIDGVDQLRKAAESEPAFRWHALTALASMENVEAGMALSQLMHLKSAETRYGAFRAMRARTPNSSLAAGTWLGDFFLHRIPSDTDAMLHFSRTKRPEIVVFGDDQTVSDDFLHVESGTTVRANGNGRVSIIQYGIDGSEDRVVCSNRVGDLIEMLSKSGFSYGDLLKMFRQSKNSGTLDSRLVVNAVPKLGRTYIAGDSDEELPPEQSDRYMAETLPELFRDGDAVEGKVKTDSKVAPASYTENIEPENSKWSKMKNWFSRDKRE